MIIIVDPLLRDVLGDRRRCMSVGNRVAINRSLVTSWHVSFLPSVFNILTISLLCQVIYRSRPVISGIQCYRFNDLVISQQVNLDARWTNAILVIVVGPLLRDALGDRHWCVGVGNGKAILGITSCCRRVISYTVFCNRVLDRLTILAYRQVIKGSRPIVAFIQHSVLVSLTIIGEEMNHNALRTKPILVVVVIPTLGYLDGSRRWRVGVGNGEAIIGITRYRRRVISYSLFCNRVLDRMAVLVYRQIIKSGCPIVALTQLFGLPILTTVD